MVAELHQSGFQRLRIVPGMSPSGMHWRCGVTHRGNISVDHGALLCHGGIGELPDFASYSSASGNEYFGWRDARQATARDLAGLFLQRFPELCQQARGSDWEYAGWYAYMLGLAAYGAFPVAYEDSPSPPPVAYMRTTGSPSRVLLPPPRELPAHLSVGTPDASSGAWSVPRLPLTVQVPEAHSPSLLLMRALHAARTAGLPEQDEQRLAEEMRAAADGEALRYVVKRWMHVRVTSR